MTCSKKKDKLHLLRGLEKILLDIDKAIRIVRETEEEAEVVPNLMIGFGIDEIQAEYVAEIKLRHLNREYILKRTDEIGELEKDIAELEDILASKPPKVKFGDHHQGAAGSVHQEVRPAPAASMLLYADELEEAEIEEEVPDYPGAPVLHPGGLLQEDHHPVAAHERGAEAQRGGRASPSRWSATQPQRAAVLHRQVPGLQDQGGGL